MFGAPRRRSCPQPQTFVVRSRKSLACRLRPASPARRSSRKPCRQPGSGLWIRSCEICGLMGWCTKMRRGPDPVANIALIKGFLGQKPAINSEVQHRRSAISVVWPVRLAGESRHRGGRGVRLRSGYALPAANAPAAPAKNVPLPGAASGCASGRRLPRGLAGYRRAVGRSGGFRQGTVDSLNR